MTNSETTTNADVAEQGATVAPEKPALKKAASPSKKAPKSRKAAHGKAKAAAAKKPAKAEQKARSSEHTNKKAAVIALMKRPKGVTATEIIELTRWLPHTVRGFVSLLASKGGEKIESTKNTAGDRTYRITK